MPFLELERLSKRFGEIDAARDVSLSVERGGVLAILGPSGSGKTTLLRLVAGFEGPDAGRVIGDGADVTDSSPAARRFGMVFQHYALFPHLTVFGNVAFGLEAQGVPADRIRARVQEVLRLLDLAGFESRRIGELSGGQQQRVALARALAPEPRVLLLDEPLSNLDPALRERTRKELRALISRVGITTLFVTHDQEEAFDLGDRIAVMNAGRIEQVGTAEELYESPASLFVATFVGRANVARARVEAPPPAPRGVGTVDLGPVRWDAKITGAVQRGTPVTVVVRPEWLKLANGSDARALAAVVAERRYMGPAAVFAIDTATGATFEWVSDPDAARPGDRVSVAPDRPVLAFA
ncbi:MAG: ABC transporter ATP-binding protein [Gemmatimonadetes bacterium]|nr:ABC transporter ATP-binding protein [Gemmatimonadota bacterium]